MRKLIVPYVLIAALAISVFTGCSSMNGHPSFSECISLGEKYLLELDYEQALVQFQLAIKIDPKNPRGYTGAAEAYVGLERIDDAIAILERGLSMTGDETVRLMLSDLVRAASPEIMLNLYAVCESGDFETVRDIMQTDEFSEIAKKAPVIFAPSSIGIGIYSVQNNFYVYYGDYDNKIRSGYGVWIGNRYTYNGIWDHYLFEGKWSEDAPNGRGKTTRNSLYDYEIPFIEYREGQLLNGLWHGEVYLSSYRDDFIEDYNNGIITVLKTDDTDSTHPYIVGVGQKFGVEFSMSDENIAYHYGIAGWAY